MRSRSPLASVRPGSPASTPWSLRVQMIRSPGLAWVPSAMRDRGAGLDDAQLDEVVADAAGQLAAQRVVGGHQQDVGAVRGQRDVGGRGGVHHLLRLPADDPAVLVVLGQHGGVAVAQPQAGGLFPGGAEPDGFGEPGVAEGAGEQGHAAAVFHRLQLAGVPGQDHLGAAGLGVGDQVGQVRAGDHRGLIDDQQRARADGDGPRAPRRPGRWPRNWALLYDTGTPAARVLRADWDGVMPITGPSPAAAQTRAASASTRVFPDPAGALITDTRLPSVSTDSAAAAWSSRSPVCVRGACVSCARPVSASSSCAGSAPSAARGLRAGHARRAARACLREHALFHGQLRARGVPHAAVPLVDAAPVGAQQAARNLDWLGCLQADDRLELRRARRGRRGPRAGRRLRPGPGRSGAAPGPGT